MYAGFAHKADTSDLILKSRWQVLGTIKNNAKAGEPDAQVFLARILDRLKAAGKGAGHVLRHIVNEQALLRAGIR